MAPNIKTLAIKMNQSMRPKKTKLPTILKSYIASVVLPIYLPKTFVKNVRTKVENSAPGKTYLNLRILTFGMLK